MPDQAAEQKKPGEDKAGTYFNAFTVNNTLVDFQLQLKLNDTDLEGYNMAPITAKNLATQLMNVVKKYEELTGTHIETFTELKERTQEKMKENEELRKEQEKKEKKEKEQKEQGQDNQPMQNK